jgi:hypothetical protein
MFYYIDSILVTCRQNDLFYILKLADYLYSSLPCCKISVRNSLYKFGSFAKYELSVISVRHWCLLKDQTQAEIKCATVSLLTKCT